MTGVGLYAKAKTLISARGAVSCSVLEYWQAPVTICLGSLVSGGSHEKGDEVEGSWSRTGGLIPCSVIMKRVQYGGGVPLYSLSISKFFILNIPELQLSSSLDLAITS